MSLFQILRMHKCVLVLLFIFLVKHIRSTQAVFDVYPYMEEYYTSSKIMFSASFTEDNNNVTCGLYEVNAVPPTTYQELIATADQTEVRTGVEASKLVTYTFSNLKALTLYDFYFFASGQVTSVLKFATRACADGFYKDPETGFCVHNSVGIYDITSNYANTGDETWYSEEILKYYDMWDEETYKDNDPNVLTDVEDAEATFEEQVEHITEGAVDNPDSRFVQIEHEYNGKEYDLLGHYNGIDKPTEEERLAEYERLKKLYDKDFVEDHTFPTNGKIYTVDESLIDYGG